MHWNLQKDGKPYVTNNYVNIFGDDGTQTFIIIGEQVDSNGNLDVTVPGYGESFEYLEIFLQTWDGQTEQYVTNSDLIFYVSECIGIEFCISETYNLPKDNCTNDPLQYGEIQVIDQWGYYEHLPDSDSYILHFGLQVQGLPHYLTGVSPSVAGIIINYNTDAPFWGSGDGWEYTNENGKLEETFSVENPETFQFSIVDFSTFGAYCGDGHTITVGLDGESEDDYTTTIGVEDDSTTIIEDDNVIDDLQTDHTKADLDITLVTRNSPPDEIKGGDRFHYILTIKNNGPNTARNVKLTGTVSDEIILAGVYKGAENIGCLKLKPIDCFLNNISAGESVILEVTSDTKQVSKKTPTIASFSVSSDTPDEKLSNNKISFEKPILRSETADLLVDFDEPYNTLPRPPPNKVSPGEVFTYTIFFYNQGPDTAKDVVVRDVLPSEVEFIKVRSPLAGQCTGGGIVQCNFGTVKHNELIFVEITVKVKNVKTNTYILNSATITSSTIDPIENNNSITIEIPRIEVNTEADLAIQFFRTTTSNDFHYDQITDIKPGQNASIVIFFENYGFSEAKDVTITVNTPDGFIVENAKINSSECSGKQQIICKYPKMHPPNSLKQKQQLTTHDIFGSNVKISGKFSDALSGDEELKVTASISSSLPDPDMTNNKKEYVIKIPSTSEDEDLPGMDDDSTEEFSQDSEPIKISKDESAISIKTDLKSLKRGTPVSIKIIKPDGTSETKGIIPTTTNFEYRFNLDPNAAPGKYQVEVKYGDQMLNDFVIDLVSENIPVWVKNNAKWWSENMIDDSSFIGGLEYLIKENILIVTQTIPQPTTSSTGIPDWIKTNAGWWANDQIPESDFLRGIQYLIENGILRINLIDDIVSNTVLKHDDCVSENKINLGESCKQILSTSVGGDGADDCIKGAFCSSGTCVTMCDTITCTDSDINITPFDDCIDSQNSCSERCFAVYNYLQKNSDDEIEDEDLPGLDDEVDDSYYIDSDDDGIEDAIDTKPFEFSNEFYDKDANISGKIVDRSNHEVKIYRSDGTVEVSVGIEGGDKPVTMESLGVELELIPDTILDMSFG